jgi:glycosyltransferase involved in cell wall biosynthesis
MWLDTNRGRSFRREQDMLSGNAPSVRHYCPDGRENGGGIGRLLGYVVDAAANEGTTHLVSDTRGLRWQVPGSFARLAGALFSMMRDRVLFPQRIHHIHIAWRGSTVRKLVLAGAARLLGCVYLQHLHDYDYAADYNRRRLWMKRWIGRTFRGADRVIVLGERDRSTVNQLLQVDNARIEVFRNCVPDPGETLPAAIGSTGTTIVFLGRLSERKGVPELLALADPRLADLSWRAVLAGDGPVDRYRAEAAAAGIDDRAVMPGWLSEAETRKLCAGADILVLPSYSEGMAMAVLEGLSHGLAVVTMRVGAHEEVISDGVNGVFVPVGDVYALAASLASLIKPPEERARLSRAARAVYLSRFSMTAYLLQLNGLYRVTASHRYAFAAAE